MGKYFGTDGIRGIANQDLTPELAYIVGRAAGEKLKCDGKNLVVIGKDTRKSGDMLESALIAGFTSMGIDVYKLGVIPTPGVAYLTRYYGAIAGVVISASHNPSEFNGIKFFGSTGFKLPDALEDEIEQLIDSQDGITHRPIREHVGIVEDRIDGIRIYEDYLKSRVNVNLNGMKVAIDCGHGATFEIAPTIFRELGAEVFVINSKPNGVNINDKCGSTDPSQISALVLEHGAHMGFSYDGDGDRLIAVDEKGNIMDGDHVLAACAKHLKDNGRLNNNGIVGTVMTNIGLDEYASKIDIKVLKAAVGDRYVLEMMVKDGYILGGEQSGHIIFLEDNTTGDGIMTSLKLAETMVDAKQTMSSLNELMITYPQVLINAKVANKYKTTYMEDNVISKAIAEMESRFNGEGRVLIRPSGTEPLVRVMLEGKNQEELETEAKKLAKLIEERCN